MSKEIFYINEYLGIAEELPKHAKIHNEAKRIKRKEQYGYEIGYLEKPEFDPCEQVFLVLDGDECIVAAAKETVIYIHGY